MKLLFLLPIFFLYCAETCIDDYTFNYAEKEMFSSAEDYTPILKWLGNNYRYEDESGDRTKLPEETYYSGSGDCEDWATLGMQMLHDAGWETTRVKIRIKGHESCHVVFRLDGRLIDNTGFNIPDYEYKIMKEISYCEAIAEAFNDND
jgi:hypothetical protein